MKEQIIDEMARIIDDNHGFIVSSVETAEALYNAGYRKQEWISVDDRFPEEREHVIVFGEDGLVGEAWHKKEGLFWWMDDRDGIAAATHWMPLPEPPKMKGGAE